MENNTFRLSNGIEMPSVGYGVYKIDGDECRKCVTDAINVGYRMIDTAQYYGNEIAVGQGIADSIVSRDELFLVTKLWFTDSGESKASLAIDESLRRLDTSYIDLMLIHQPIGDYYGTWRAMEQAYADGRIRAIGVSNFSPERLVDLSHFAKVPPMVDQLELHVFNQQIEARKVAGRYGCHIMAWGPLARGRNDFFSNPVLVAIGEKYGKTVSQIALRYLVQLGISVIPKTTHYDRMVQNIAIDDFTLTADDMSALAMLDKNETLFFDLHRVSDLEEMLKR